MNFVPTFSRTEVGVDNVPDWKDGVGLAALALMSALLDKLRMRGVFEDSEVVEIIG